MKRNKKVQGPRSFDDAKFLEKTGRTFTEWKKILDRFDVKKNGHTAAAKFLRNEYDTPDWWTQAIIVKYEWEVGIKKEPIVPSDLKKLLSMNPKARDRFYSYSASHKREFLNWINEAKKEETRKRRLEKIISELIQ